MTGYVKNVKAASFFPSGNPAIVSAIASTLNAPRLNSITAMLKSRDSSSPRWLLTGRGSLRLRLTCCNRWPMGDTLE